MGKSVALVNADEIVEGLPLECDDLVAVVAWNDLACPPLLRIHSAHTGARVRSILRNWAAMELSRGRRLAALTKMSAREILNGTS